MTDLQNSLTLNDFTMMVNIIDTCTERGSFKGNELVAVGTVREKFAEFVKSHTAKATEVQPDQADDTNDDDI